MFLNACTWSLKPTCALRDLSIASLNVAACSSAIAFFALPELTALQPPSPTATSATNTRPPNSASRIVIFRLARPIVLSHCWRVRGSPFHLIRVRRAKVAIDDESRPDAQRTRAAAVCARRAARRSFRGRVLLRLGIFAGRPEQVLKLAG